ncbi:hypothetical protein [Polyangium sorediatum]|uniref:Outer membrane protein beta-barrel domain-containing protein n=1 Tax=Polyangium sorediatum TaxID=889274 RepID=A0ABT6NW13_9BACT|nr:hypothetical protein [Polyangium sorediatum]MDI1432493.1 hypothetical protein [Polyangium sorediatum]
MKTKCLLPGAAGLVLLVATSAASAEPKDEARNGPPEWGFAIQPSFSTAPRGHVDGSLLLGAALPRLVLGLGVDLSRAFDEPHDDPLFIPYAELQGTLLRSEDRRTELFVFGSVGRVPIGVTSAFTRERIFRWRVAPGLRVWPLRSLAVTAAVGLTADEYERFGHDDWDQGQHVTMFGRLGLLVVLGK